MLQILILRVVQHQDIKEVVFHKSESSGFI